MNILVTGSSGFLGKHLVEQLIRSGHVVTAVNSKNCDLRNNQSLTQFERFTFDQIFHLAAWTQAGDFCLRHPGDQWIINQQINTNVLSWWQRDQPQAKLIAIGTSCAYDPSFPLSEDNYLNGKPIDSFLSYGMTKRMLLYGLMSISKQFNTRYLYLIPSTLYGSGYHSDGRQLHFIFDLIKKILLGHIYGNPVILWGDGEQKRELIHVADFVKYMMQLQDINNEIVNVGSGVEYTIKQFAKIICDCVGYPFEKIIFDESKYVGARSKVLSINKVSNLLPEYILRDLKGGLNETIEWVKECQLNTITL